MERRALSKRAEAGQATNASRVPDITFSRASNVGGLGSSGACAHTRRDGSRSRAAATMSWMHSRLLHLRALLIPLTATAFFVVHPSSGWAAVAFGVSAFFPPFPKDGERVDTASDGRLGGIAYALFVLQCLNLPLA